MACEECASSDLPDPAADQDRGGHAATPLHRAAGLGHLDCITSLLGSGAPQRPDGLGRTPLDIATLEGHHACATLLRAFSAAAATPPPHPPAEAGGGSSLSLLPTPQPPPAEAGERFPPTPPPAGVEGDERGEAQLTAAAPHAFAGGAVSPALPLPEGAAVSPPSGSSSSSRPAAGFAAARGAGGSPADSQAAPPSPPPNSPLSPLGASRRAAAAAAQQQQQLAPPPPTPPQRGSSVTPEEAAAAARVKGYAARQGRAVEMLLQESPASRRRRELRGSGMPALEGEALLVVCASEEATRRAVEAAEVESRARVTNAAALPLYVSPPRRGGGGGVVGGGGAARIPELGKIGCFPRRGELGGGGVWWGAQGVGVVPRGTTDASFPPDPRGSAVSRSQHVLPQARPYVDVWLNRQRG